MADKKEIKLNEEMEQYEQYVLNPILWAEDYFAMPIQKILPEYENLLLECRKTGNYKQMHLNMFEPFAKYEMFTWQQGEILHAVKDAVSGKKSRKISIRSGHGIGKSSVLSVIIMWFLFANYNSNVGCTAPTSQQMHDVLRKELRLWIQRLPEEIQEIYKRTADYLRVGDETSFDTRFARAITASKDRPEALAGMHAEDLLILADEASGIVNEVFEFAKSSLTNENTLFIMISNPTRVEGYFYESFKKLASSFQNLHFNSEESPIVDEGFINEIITEYGKESDQYKIRVLGEFPEHGDMDDEGWIDLFDFSKISFVPEEAVANHNPTKMGLDPSGEGRDKTPRAVRDEMLLRIVAEQGRSTPKSIANTTISLLYTYEKITPDEVVYDNFGVGANVGVELADAGYKCTGINSANDASDTDTFENLRAEMFRRFRNWLYAGGQLVGDEVYWEDLKMIKYKRNTKGKIQIIPKKLLLKRYGKSPDRPDAGSYCFHKMQPLAKKKLIKPPRRHINPLTGEYLPVQEKRLDEDFISPKTIDLW